VVSNAAAVRETSSFEDSCFIVNNLDTQKVECFGRYVDFGTRVSNLSLQTERDVRCGVHDIEPHLNSG